MGQGELFAIDTSTYENLLALVGSLSVMDGIQEIEETWDDERRLLCWKSWSEVHCCLNGGRYNPKHVSLPLEWCLLGNRHICNPNDGYIAAVLPADRVPEVAAALDAVDAKWFREQCDRIFLKEFTQEWFDELLGLLNAIKIFYNAAAAANYSVLFTSDEILSDIYPSSDIE